MPGEWHWKHLPTSTSLPGASGKPRASPERVEGACPEPVEGACPEPVEGIRSCASDGCASARPAQRRGRISLRETGIRAPPLADGAINVPQCIMIGAHYKK